MTKKELWKLLDPFRDGGIDKEDLMAAIEDYCLSLISKKLPSHVDYLKKQIEGILFDRKHYPFIDDTIVLRLIDEAFKEAKLIENYNNEIIK